MAKLKPISLDKLYNELRQFYGSMRAQMERQRKILGQNFDYLLPNLPQGVTVFQSSTASNIISSLRDQIRTDEPVVDFVERGESKKAQDHKTKMKMWGQFALDTLPQFSLADLFHQGAEDLLSSGAACWKFMVDLEQYPDAPERKSLSPDKYKKAMKEWRLQQGHVWPYVVKPIDPLSVFPEPGHRLPRYMIERQERRLFDVVSMYPNWSDPIGKKLHASGKVKDADNLARVITWTEFWSEPVYADGKLVENGWYMVEADGELVIDEVNPYSVLPYIWDYSGLGRANFDADPKYLAKGVLTDIVGELEAEVIMKTMAMLGWQYHHLPRLMTDGDPETVRQQMMVGPAGIIKVDDMSRPPRWLEHPAPNREMTEFLDRVEKSIGKKAPSALTDRPTGVDAAIHQALIIGQSLKTLTPIVNTLNRMASRLLNNMARQAYKMNLTMNITGRLNEVEKERMVKPTDFTHYTFSVVFEATDPLANDRRLLASLPLMRLAQLMSRQTWRETFGRGIFKSNEEEEVRIAAERLTDIILQTPELLSTLMQGIELDEANAGEEGIMSELQGRAQASVGEAVPGARQRALEGLTGGSPGVSTDQTSDAAFAAAGVARDGPI